MRTLAIAGVLASCAVGCTLLVSFDDVPSRGDPIDEELFDAGKRSSSSGSSSSSGGESSSSSSGEVVPTVDAGSTEKFPPDCDPAIDLTGVGCGNYIRSECESEPQITGAALQAGDLIDCNAAKQPTCVRHCPHGCAEMPTGFADQCDDCFGKEDGTYCAADFRNWAAASDVFAIQCEGGKKAAQTNCSDTATACKTQCTIGTTAPACCQ